MPCADFCTFACWSDLIGVWLPASLHFRGSGGGPSVHGGIPADEEETVHHGVPDAADSKDQPGPSEGKGWAHPAGKAL